MRAQSSFIASALLFALVACRDSVPSGPGTADLAASHRSPASDSAYVVVLANRSPDPAGWAQSFVAANGGAVRLVYHSVFSGFAGRLPPAAVAILRRDPNIAWVEPDRTFRLDTTETFNLILPTDPRWGLERIDQRGAVGISTWTYSWVHNGGGVYVYLIDTGLDSTQTEFQGRGKNVFDVFGQGGQDCEGHGTHVAGIVGSHTWGVAKGALLRGVRVFGCTDTTAISNIIAGIDWVYSNHSSPAVVNLSLGGPFSSPLNAAVDSLVQAGLFVAVSAGNDNDDACNYSPSSVASAVVVAASHNRGNALDMNKASFSNFGTCVDIYAPGDNIQSTKLGGGSAVMSGTSMAAPFVAAAAAIYKSALGDSLPSVITSWLTTNATSGVIGSNPAGTPNLFLYKPPTF